MHAVCMPFACSVRAISSLQKRLARRIESVQTLRRRRCDDVVCALLQAYLIF